MGFLLAVLSFVVAEEVVELEPVNVNGNTFLCDQYNSATCTSEPGARAYCIWNATAGPAKCVDDPQLRILMAGDDTSAGSCANSQDGADGQIIDLSAYLTADCAASKGTGKICARTPGKSVADFNYCVYAWLRDGECPPSVCVRNTQSSYAGSGRNQCIPNNQQQCTMLHSKTECGLNPKCVWKSSGDGSCLQDPCFVGSENKQCGGTFLDGIGWIDATVANRKSWQKRFDDSALQPADCVLYQPYKIGGGTSNYCVYKENSNPNKCYFLKSNTSTGNTNYNTDYLQTYPTYGPGKTVECTATISACDSQDSGECATKWNPKGAFAGQYCGDATHGGSSLLGVPSLLVFLISAFLSLLAL